MKRLLFILIIALILPSCSPRQQEEEESAELIPPILIQEPVGEPPKEELPEVLFSVEPLSRQMMNLITGSSWLEDSPVPLDELSCVTVSYLNFDGETKVGQLIVHHTVGEEVSDIFRELYDAGFPIAGIQLIDAYNADDDLSMAANNTYSFCSRLILGTQRYSNHSYGIAIDINPVQNPYLVGGRVLPEAGAEYLDRQDVRPGMIVPGDICHSTFTQRGWTWGGDWPSPDYQHFEKAI